jgi:hypothetical protein
MSSMRLATRSRSHGHRKVNQKFLSSKHFDTNYFKIHHIVTQKSIRLQQSPSRLIPPLSEFTQLTQFTQPTAPQSPLPKKMKIYFLTKIRPNHQTTNPLRPNKLQ